MRFCISQILLLLLLSAAAKGEKCKPSGKIRGKKPPKNKCNPENNSECCKQGKLYTTYECSPPVSRRTKAVLTLNCFEKGGDGGGRSGCDQRFHSDKTKVVDECDSTRGCDNEHDYQPPCSNNIVDASLAVWVCRRKTEVGWKFSGLMDIDLAF